MVGFVFGVVPEFQGTGVDYFMIVEAEKVIKARGRYSEIELQWQGDFNPKMEALHKAVGAKFAKRHVNYRKLFDQSQDVEKMHTI